MSKSNLDNKNKKFSAKLFEKKNEGAEIDGGKYQIYCNRWHLLHLTHEEFYRTIVRGHVITTLRIREFTPFGLEKKIIW